MLIVREGGGGGGGGGVWGWFKVLFSLFLSGCYFSTSFLIYFSFLLIKKIYDYISFVCLTCGHKWELCIGILNCDNPSYISIYFRFSFDHSINGFFINIFLFMYYIF